MRHAGTDCHCELAAGSSRPAEDETEVGIRASDTVVIPAQSLRSRRRGGNPRSVIAISKDWVPATAFASAGFARE